MDAAVAVAARGRGRPAGPAPAVRRRADRAPSRARPATAAPSSSAIACARTHPGAAGCSAWVATPVTPSSGSASSRSRRGPAGLARAAADLPGRRDPVGAERDVAVRRPRGRVLLDTRGSVELAMSAVLADGLPVLAGGRAARDRLGPQPRLSAVVPLLTPPATRSGWPSSSTASASRRWVSRIPEARDGLGLSNGAARRCCCSRSRSARSSPCPRPARPSTAGARCGSSARGRRHGRARARRRPRLGAGGGRWCRHRPSGCSSTASASACGTSR